MNALSEGRRSLAREFSKHEVETLFIESACDDEKIIEENVRSVKISSPDYIGWSSDDAVKHYLARMSAKIPHFETMDESDLNYIKMINAGERITVNNCSFGYLSHRYVIYFPGYSIYQRYPSPNKPVKCDLGGERLLLRVLPLHRYSSREQAKGIASHRSEILPLERLVVSVSRVSYFMNAHLGSKPKAVPAIHIGHVVGLAFSCC